MSDVIIVRIPANASQTACDVQLAPVVNSLDDVSRQLPEGVYTTFRTYQKNHVLRLFDHFDRLENSARLTGREFSLDIERVRIELRKALLKYAHDEARVRISIDLAVNFGDIYLILEELHVPSMEEYRQGVATITKKMHRENPEAKVTSFISKADEARNQTSSVKINETLMVSEDDIVLEGLSSNFFGIINDIIYTAGEGVLPGITRKIAIDVAEMAGYQVVFEGIHIANLPKLSEAFITSASRAILPVTTINNRPVGTGHVGQITRMLQIAFQKKLDAALDRI